MRSLWTLWCCGDLLDLQIAGLVHNLACGIRTRYTVVHIIYIPKGNPPDLCNDPNAQNLIVPFNVGETSNAQKGVESQHKRELGGIGSSDLAPGYYLGPTEGSQNELPHPYANMRVSETM